MRFDRHYAWILFLVLVLFSQPTLSQSTLQAQPSSPSTKQPLGTRQGNPKPGCTDNGTYVNRQGKTVKRPETCSSPPQGATAQCRDGTYSFSRSRRGTCSHHGGVAKWF